MWLLVHPVPHRLLVERSRLRASATSDSFCDVTEAAYMVEEQQTDSRSVFRAAVPRRIFRGFCGEEQRKFSGPGRMGSHMLDGPDEETRAECHNSVLNQDFTVTKSRSVFPPQIQNS
jgi:hypothetical protein